MPEKHSGRTICVLCGNPEITFFFKDKHREYVRCRICGLVFVPHHHRLSREEELKRYALHRNDPTDEGYRRFLFRMFEQMNALVPPGGRGLDFGSGPNPVLSRIFIQHGYDFDIYDPFYACDRSVFSRKYDFITATEVIEHLFEPQKELDLLWSCLKPGGFLGIMTKLLTNKKSFGSWYYKEDKSHVAFFSKDTFIWLGKKWNAPAKFIGDDIVILCKDSPSQYNS